MSKTRKKLIFKPVKFRITKNAKFYSSEINGFTVSACENSVEFPAESGCKANDLTLYKVDTARRFLPYI